MIASLNIMAKTFAKIAKVFVGLLATIVAIKRKPGLQKVNDQRRSKSTRESMLVKVNDGRSRMT